jgi:hypothetical protein
VSDSPIRDRVRSRKREQFVRRANWIMLGINFSLCVAALVVFR